MSTEIPDICLYMRRLGAVHDINMASIAKRTQMSFNLIYVFEEGTIAENLHRAIARSKSRWCCFMDDDVEVLTDNWLRMLMQRMEQYPDIGVMTIGEIHEQEIADGYLSNSLNWLSGVDIRTWCQGCVHLYDKDRLDEGKIPLPPIDSPPPTGMCDVDMSWQVRGQGLKCGRCREVVVWHHPKQRDNPEYVEKYQEIRPETIEWRWKELRLYMANRWGHHYFQNNIVIRDLENRP